MKTTKYIAILGLAMILIGANAGNLLTDRPGMTKKMNIRYDVNVILDRHIELCNTYVIRITDETGRLVAPPKIFDPAKQKYVFTENGPATGKVRVAEIVLATTEDTYLCPVFLGARPDVKIGPFFKGEIYSFVLRPFVTAPPDKE